MMLQKFFQSAAVIVKVVEIAVRLRCERVCRGGVAKGGGGAIVDQCS